MEIKICTDSKDVLIGSTGTTKLEVTACSGCVLSDMNTIKTMNKLYKSGCVLCYYGSMCIHIPVQ